MYTRTGSKPILMMALVALIALLIGACAPVTPVSPTDAPGGSPTAAPVEEATVAPTEEATEEEAGAEASATPAPEEEAATEDGASTDTLEGVTWQLVEFLNASDELTVAAAEATITFADGQVSGSAGCNNYFAGYTLDGEQLTIEQAGSTMMACEEPAMSQEQAFLARLTEAASYAIVEGQLQILDADGNILLVFSQQAAAASGAEVPGLEGVAWQLVEFLDASDAVTAASAEATITFEAGSVGGTTGCNNFSAGYTVDGQQLTVELGMSTMMACEEAIMAQEQAILERLAQAATYEIVDGQLHIFDANGNLLLAFTQLEATALTGITWVATNYNNGNQAVVGVVEGSELTAVFGEDGSLTGMAGCNNFMTDYTVDGDQITISPAATTRMMCEEPEGIMEQEAAFVMALSTAATFSIQGDVLEMRTADDAMVARFVAN